MLRGIDRFKDPRVTEVMEPASIMIMLKILFSYPLLEDVDESATPAWIMGRGLWKFYDSVPQPPALEPVAYASLLDFLLYQCYPPATD
jgi:hypothetical protein